MIVRSTLAFDDFSFSFLQSRSVIAVGNRRPSKRNNSFRAAAPNNFRYFVKSKSAACREHRIHQTGVLRVSGNWSQKFNGSYLKHNTIEIEKHDFSNPLFRSRIEFRWPCATLKGIAYSSNNQVDYIYFLKYFRHETSFFHSCSKNLSFQLSKSFKCFSLSFSSNKHYHRIFSKVDKISHFEEKRLFCKHF